MTAKVRLDMLDCIDHLMTNRWRFYNDHKTCKNETYREGINTIRKQDRTKISINHINKENKVIISIIFNI